MKKKILVIAEFPFEFLEPFKISEYEITSSACTEKTQDYSKNLGLIVVEINKDNQYEVILWFADKIAHLKIPTLFWFDELDHPAIIKALKLEAPDNEIGFLIKNGSKYHLINGIVKFLGSIKK